jgi:hypothetical protein
MEIYQKILTYRSFYFRNIFLKLMFSVFRVFFSVLLEAQVKEDEIGKVCSVTGEKRNTYRGLGGGDLKESGCMEDLCIDERMIL